ncbi:MAG: bifunctional folylpolyglutamate synthase/dihydrofolate synthase [Clostridiales bacterium]|nr:bifunctional folylpolyglutamate synthase/dihydrofolate synthase [Clostridiales bacterium]
MDYQEARKYIDTYFDVSQRYGGTMGLDSIRCFLEHLGNPQEDLKFIHIGGTNGKGSVGAYLDRVLREAGYRVGRYVSPTLYEYRERIQVSGVYISEEEFAELVSFVAPVLEEIKEKKEPVPSPFEIETVLSFLYYKEKKCDLVLLECGLGGETDATNIVQNTELAVLTSISMDHMEFLGDTIGAIAKQKAGIIKPGASVVTCLQQPEAAVEIEKKCREGRNLLAVGKVYNAQVLESDLEHLTFTFGGRTVTIHLAGAHQLENAVLALTGVQALLDRGYEITEEQIQAGFEKAEWNGRFTVLRKAPYFIVDGAHNPDAAKKLKKSIRMYFPGKRLIFLMGLFRDKQYEEISAMLAPMADTVVAMEAADNPRALPAEELAETVKKYNKNVRASKNLREAVEMGLSLAGKEDVVIAFGSLSFISEITDIVKG